MARSLRSICLLGAFALVGSAQASAQDVPLSQLLVNLIQSDIRLQPPPAGALNHEAHFVPGANQRLAPYLFNQQLVEQLATFPIGSPAGGFAFAFDAASGTFQRATNTFGPAFADRALTNGRQKLTFGANFQYSKYSSFEGQDLNSGDINFYLTHEDVPGEQFFEGDLIQAALSLDLSSATTTVFANYGITDALDLAVAVPIVHVSMDAKVNATILHLATTGAAASLHEFPGGASTKLFTASGSATGIGDVLVRGKYRFVSAQGGGLAAGVDLRLPSGSAEDLLGTGATAVTVSLIGSGTHGSFAPHFNIGYTGSGDSDVVDISNEFNYKVGSEFAASPRVTLNADLLGRTLLDSGRLQLGDVTHSYRNLSGIPGSVTLREYQLQSGSLNLLDLALGGKFNVTSNLLVNANVLLGLTDAGISSRFTPVIGFDYTF